MKLAAIVVLLITLTTNSFSQETKPSLTRSDYLLKSKHQKTAAWIFLGAGLVLTVSGMVIGLNDAVETIAYAFVGESKVNNTGVVLFYSGLLSMAGSIPFFIASAKNKHRAMSLSLKNETRPSIHSGSFVYRSYPSVVIRYQLNRNK